MTWWTGRLIGLDLETTHADPEEARIVTAALVAVGDGEVLRSTWTVNPGIEIPEEATAIHGLTTDHVRGHGIEAARAVAMLAESLWELTEAGPLVAFNARYDLTVLDREVRRHAVRLPTPLTWGTLGRRVIDPLVIDKHIDKYRKGSRKLDAMCEHYDATLDGAHDATADALAACRVAYRIGQRGRVIRRAWNPEMERERADLVEEWDRVRGDLDLLHAAQERWAHEQAVGLAEHFERTGEDASGVRTEWPLYPPPDIVEP